MTSPPLPTDPLEADRGALRSPQRESPFGPLFLAWAVVRQLGFLNIGIFTAVVGSRNFQLFGLLGSFGLLVAGFARWYRFTYELESSAEGDQLVTMAGVLSRTRTSVPLDRVQSVSTRQNLLHRICNLVEVNVQTAGSAQAEVQLTAVRPAVADQLRRLTTATRTSGSIDAPLGGFAEPSVGTDQPMPPPPPSEVPVLRRSTSDILKVALTRNPIVLLAPIPLALFLLSELDEVVDDAGGRVGDTFGRIAGSTAGVVALVIGVLLVSAAASVAFVVLRLHDLRLFVDGAGLRRLAGLISRTEVTASVERVQVLAVKRNPLERMLGHHELVMPLAGATGGATVQVGNSVPSTLQLPGTLAGELDHIGDLVLGSHRQTEVASWQGLISELADRRWTLWIGLVPSLIVVVASWFVIGAWSLLALAWIAIAFVVVRMRRRSWSWSLSPETLRVTHGVITTTTRTMPVRKTQNVSLRRGIFHRRNGLADVRVRTASRVQMVVPMVPVATAEALRDELLFRSESDPRPFM